jgi:hypothetical protein
MYTENGLISEAKNFLLGKNMFDGNLFENKQFAYTSLLHQKDNEASQEHADLNNQIDDELDTQDDYASSMHVTRVVNSRSKRFRSTGFGGQEDNNSRTHTAGAASMRSTKFKIKSLKTTDMKERSTVKFGSSKNLRVKMKKINGSIHKLQLKGKINWSKNDLKAKYLQNGANFSDSYNRSTHTLLDHMKSKQINDLNSKAKYEGIITGNPYSEFSMQNSKPKNLSIKATFDLDKSKIISGKNNEINTIQSMTNALNTDQKYSYIINRATKYNTTKTIQKDNGGKSSRIQNKGNPFTKDFGYNTQSRPVYHGTKRPQTSVVNHSRDLYDPITRLIANKTPATTANLARN